METNTILFSKFKPVLYMLLSAILVMAFGFVLLFLFDWFVLHVVCNIAGVVLIITSMLYLLVTLVKIIFKYE